MARRKVQQVGLPRRGLVLGAAAAIAAGTLLAIAGGRPHVSASWFYSEVIVPTLRHLELDHHRRAPLLLGTALVETNLADVTQQPGPALGYFQMEPSTHDAIWEQLRNFPAYGKLVRSLLPPGIEPSAKRMVVDAPYACGMAAVLYEGANRFRQGLPRHDDYAAQAAYWKKFWNTPLGKGTVEGYLARWRDNGAAAIVSAFG